MGQIAFGLCALLFGAAHFVYMNYTAPLIPKWLPPSQEFWGYATGVFHIAGGLAILAGVQARLAAILLTVMYAAFIPLVFVPVLMTEPSALSLDRMRHHHRAGWSHLGHRGFVEAGEVKRSPGFHAVRHLSPRMEDW